MKIRVAKPAAMDGTGGKGEREAGAKGKLRKLFLHDGDKTQKSWKPLLNTIFVLEAYRNAPCNEFRSSPLPRLPFSLPARPIHGRRLCYSNFLPAIQKNNSRRTLLPPA